MGFHKPLIRPYFYFWGVVALGGCLTSHGDNDDDNSDNDNSKLLEVFDYLPRITAKTF